MAAGKTERNARDAAAAMSDREIMRDERLRALIPLRRSRALGRRAGS
jgi:hypothetical protein